jgi:hypothetical protein
MRTIHRTSLPTRVPRSRNDHEDGGPTIQLPAAEPAAPLASVYLLSSIYGDERYRDFPADAFPAELNFVNGFTAQGTRDPRCDDGHQQEREHNRIITG